VALIGKKDQDVLRKRFSAMQHKVKIVMFEAALDCVYCPQTKQILEEMIRMA